MTEVLENIRQCGERFNSAIRWVFLSDGDGLVVPTRHLLAILTRIREHIPATRRVSSYCLPRNLRRKSVAALRELATACLSIANVGAESGDDELLELVHKSESFASTLAALEKLGTAGSELSLRHASDWLVSKCTLGADGDRLLGELRRAITEPGTAPLQPAWVRGL